MNALSLTLAATAILGGSTVAQGPGASRVTVLFSDLQTHPSNLVPGSNVLRFRDVPRTPFGPLSVNASGQWALIAETSRGANFGQVILRDGLVAQRRNDPQPFANSTLTWSSFVDLAMDSNGEFAITGNVGDTIGVEALVRLSPPGPGSICVQSLTPIGTQFPGAALVFWEDVRSAVLTDGGDSGGLGIATNPGNFGAITTRFAFLGNELLLVEGDSPPASIAGTTINRFRHVAASPDGSTVLVWAATTFPTSPTPQTTLVCVNGAAVLQGGAIVPGSGFTVPIRDDLMTGIREADIDGSGRWFARGTNGLPGSTTLGGPDWIVQDGAVIAVSDRTQEVSPGSGEFWDDTFFEAGFFAFDSNHAGDTLVGGFTSAPASGNAVLALERADGAVSVLAREGDAIDLDGNGLLDDDTFIFGWPVLRRGSRLLPDGSALSILDLEDPSGIRIGTAVVRIGEPTATCSSDNGTGVNPTDLSCTTEPRLGTTWELDIATNVDTLSTALLLSLAPAAPFTIPGLGSTEFLIDLSTAVEVPPTSIGEYRIELPRASTSGLWDLPLFLQGLRLDSAGGVPTLIATNRIDAVLGF